jgi:hypothetical protein
MGYALRYALCALRHALRPITSLLQYFNPTLNQLTGQPAYRSTSLPANRPTSQTSYYYKPFFCIV